jgi:two-component system, NarL family, response regulator LiaR
MTVRQPIRVALVNDFELVLRGIESMLGQFADRVTVAELNVERNPDHRVDVALFDTYGHIRGGIDRVRSLATDPRVGAVVVYTWRLPAGQLDAAIAAGARGVLAKSLSAEELADALIAIHTGETVVSPAFRRPQEPSWPGHDFGLTQRESEVAAFLAEGYSNREIADALFVSEHTVKTHLKAIFRKAGVASRARAIARISADPGFRRARSVA